MLTCLEKNVSSIKTYDHPIFFMNHKQQYKIDIFFNRISHHIFMTQVLAIVQLKEMI